MHRFLSAALVLLGAGTAFGGVTVLVDEPFNYADNAAFNAVWNANANPNDFYTMDGTFGNPLPSYKMPSPTANFTGRSALNLGGDFNGTDANPLVIAFDFYLSDAGAATLWNGARHYVELRGYSGDAFGVGSLENLLAMGVYNATDAPDGAHSNVYYQGRVTFGSGWSTLNDLGGPGRATGWHRLQIAVTSTQVQFSVDGVLAEVESRPNALGFDNVVLGSDLTAAGHTAWVDNLSVVIVPEPASLALLALAGLFIRRRR